MNGADGSAIAGGADVLDRLFPAKGDGAIHELNRAMWATKFPPRSRRCFSVPKSNGNDMAWMGTSRWQFTDREFDEAARRVGTDFKSAYDATKPRLKRPRSREVRFPSAYMKTTSIDQQTRPEGALFSGAGRLEASERALHLTLESAKSLGDESGLPGEWCANWSRQWEIVQGLLHRLQSLLGEMSGHVEKEGSDGLRQAMDSWRQIQAQDGEMNSMLDDIRSQAKGLSGNARVEWTAVDVAIKAHMEAIHARALALRVKLELMKDYTKKEVNHLLEGMLANLPNQTKADTQDAEAYAQHYRQTVRELDAERHEFGGFIDFVKGLAMWVETPEERMKKTLFPEGGKS